MLRRGRPFSILCLQYDSGSGNKPADDRSRAYRAGLRIDLPSIEELEINVLRSCDFAAAILHRANVGFKGPPWNGSR